MAGEWAVTVEAARRAMTWVTMARVAIAWVTVACVDIGRVEAGRSTTARVATVPLVPTRWGGADALIV